MRSTEGSLYGPYLNESRPNVAELHRAAPPAKAKKSAPLPTVLLAVLVGAGIAVAGGVYAHFTTGAGTLLAQDQTDRLSDEQAQQRLRSFEALGSLSLQAVPTANVSTAVDGMRLKTAEKSALLEAARAESSPLRLAWITLWDTDVQDGDVVRIDAQGYSRTVTLTKHGETFAVPVPANGIVTVTGIKDGDGGGITVGLASGRVKAVFPIMSTGQSLGLRVTID